MEIKYTRRTPKEEYGYEELTLVKTIKDTADVQEAVKALQAEANKALYDQEPEVEEEEEETLPPKKRGKKKVEEEEEETLPPKKRGKKKVEEEEEEPEQEEEEEDDEKSDEENDEEESEDDEEEKPKSKKKLRKKAATYDREHELHKKLLGEFLDKCDAGWMKNPKKKAKAKKISEEMQGKEFLDDEGKIVSSFLIAVRKKFKGA